MAENQKIIGCSRIELLDLWGREDRLERFGNRKMIDYCYWYGQRLKIQFLPAVP